MLGVVALALCQGSHSWWWCLPGPWSINTWEGGIWRKGLTSFQTSSLIYWELGGAVVAGWWLIFKSWVKLTVHWSIIY